MKKLLTTLLTTLMMISVSVPVRADFESDPKLANTPLRDADPSVAWPLIKISIILVLIAIVVGVILIIRHNKKKSGK